MKYLIGGYGTLLYQGSLNKSLKREKKTKKKIIQYFPYTVKDYQRLFNLRAPHYNSSTKISRDLIENAAANVKKNKKFSFNGLCFYVTEKELMELDKREKYYDRVKTMFYDFETGEELEEGFIYVSNEKNKHLIDTSVETLLPCWPDISMARSGAYIISDEFGKAYDNTTFLADGKTLAIDFYKKNGLDKDLINYDRK